MNESPYSIIHASTLGKEREEQFKTAPYLLVVKRSESGGTTALGIICGAVNQATAEDLLSCIHLQERVEALAAGPIFGILEDIKELNRVLFNFEPGSAPKPQNKLEAEITGYEKQLDKEFETIEIDDEEETDDEFVDRTKNGPEQKPKLH